MSELLTVGQAERENTKKLTRKQLLMSVADAVTALSMRNLGGIDQIESIPAGNVATLPIFNTVFGVIAEKARILGVEVGDTVGSVMQTVFGLKIGSIEAADQAHEVGCACHGNFISPLMASERIRNFANKVSE